MSLPDPRKPSAGEHYERRELKPIADRWDAKAADWDRNLQDPECHLNEDDAYARFLLVLSAQIDRREAFCRTHGVIDVGCATGLVLSSIVHRFAWGLGIDISPEMVRMAKAKDIPNARFLVGDCFKLSGDYQAGVVVSRGVLLSHYGHNHAQDFLNSLHRGLAPGGFVMCDFLTLAGKDHFQHLPQNKTYFSPEQVCEAAMASGFRNARTLCAPGRRVDIIVAE